MNFNSKKCSTCKATKTLNEFHKSSNECKPCKHERYIKFKDVFFPKVNCSCGRIVFKPMFNVHLNSKIHKILTEASVHSNIKMIKVN